MTHTKDEALKLAREALQEPLGFTGSREIDAKLRSAIADVKQALAAPVQPGRNHYEDGDVFERIAAMNKPPAAASVQELYNELLYAVVRVHPNETRHQTALRYIQQAESGGADQCTAAHGIGAKP
jgi:hypothetical protein